MTDSLQLILPEDEKKTADGDESALSPDAMAAALAASALRMAEEAKRAAERLAELKASLRESRAHQGFVQQPEARSMPEAESENGSGNATKDGDGVALLTDVYERSDINEDSPSPILPPISGVNVAAEQTDAKGPENFREIVVAEDDEDQKSPELVRQVANAQAEKEWEKLSSAAESETNAAFASNESKTELDEDSVEADESAKDSVDEETETGRVDPFEYQMFESMNDDDTESVSMPETNEYVEEFHDIEKDASQKVKEWQSMFQSRSIHLQNTVDDPSEKVDDNLCYFENDTNLVLDNIPSSSDKREKSEFVAEDGDKAASKDAFDAMPIIQESIVVTSQESIIVGGIHKLDEELDTRNIDVTVNGAEADTETNVSNETEDWLDDENGENDEARKAAMIEVSRRLAEIEARFEDAAALSTKEDADENHSSRKEDLDTVVDGFGASEASCLSRAIGIAVPLEPSKEITADPNEAAISIAPLSDQAEVKEESETDGAVVVEESTYSVSVVGLPASVSSALVSTTREADALSTNLKLDESLINVDNKAHIDTSAVLSPPAEGSILVEDVDLDSSKVLPVSETFAPVGSVDKVDDAKEDDGFEQAKHAASVPHSNEDEEAVTNSLTSLSANATMNGVVNIQHVLQEVTEGSSTQGAPCASAELPSVSDAGVEFRNVEPIADDDGAASQVVKSIDAPVDMNPSLIAKENHDTNSDAAPTAGTIRSVLPEDKQVVAEEPMGNNNVQAVDADDGIVDTVTQSYHKDTAIQNTNACLALSEEMFVEEINEVSSVFSSLRFVGDASDSKVKIEEDAVNQELSQGKTSTFIATSCFPGDIHDVSAALTAVGFRTDAKNESEKSTIAESEEDNDNIVLNASNVVVDADVEVRACVGLSAEMIAEELREVSKALASLGLVPKTNNQAMEKIGEECLEPNPSTSNQSPVPESTLNATEETESHAVSSALEPVAAQEAKTEATESHSNTREQYAAQEAALDAPEAPVPQAALNAIEAPTAPQAVLDAGEAPVPQSTSAGSPQPAFQGCAAPEPEVAQEVSAAPPESALSEKKTPHEEFVEIESVATQADAVASISAEKHDAVVVDSSHGDANELHAGQVASKNRESTVVSADSPSLPAKFLSDIERMAAMLSAIGLQPDIAKDQTVKIDRHDIVKDQFVNIESSKEEGTIERNEATEEESSHPIAEAIEEATTSIVVSKEIEPPEVKIEPKETPETTSSHAIAETHNETATLIVLPKEISVDGQVNSSPDEKAAFNLESSEPADDVSLQDPTTDCHANSDFKLYGDANISFVPLIKSSEEVVSAESSDKLLDPSTLQVHGNDNNGIQSSAVLPSENIDQASAPSQSCARKIKDVETEAQACIMLSEEIFAEEYQEVSATLASLTTVAKSKDGTSASPACMSEEAHGVSEAFSTFGMSAKATYDRLADNASTIAPSTCFAIDVVPVVRVQREKSLVDEEDKPGIKETTGTTSCMDLSEQMIAEEMEEMSATIASLRLGTNVASGKNPNETDEKFKMSAAAASLRLGTNGASDTKTKGTVEKSNGEEVQSTKNEIIQNNSLREEPSEGFEKPKISNDMIVESMAADRANCGCIVM